MVDFPCEKNAFEVFINMLVLFMIAKGATAGVTMKYDSSAC